MIILLIVAAVVFAYYGGASCPKILKDNKQMLLGVLVGLFLVKFLNGNNIEGFDSATHIGCVARNSPLTGSAQLTSNSGEEEKCRVFNLHMNCAKEADNDLTQQTEIEVAGMLLDSWTSFFGDRDLQKLWIKEAGHDETRCQSHTETIGDMTSEELSNFKSRVAQKVQDLP